MSRDEGNPTDIEAKEERPWERPGQVRRDCEPHRGPLLLFLAKASLVCSLLSLCGGIASFVGLPLSVIIYALAKHDHRRMKIGLLDPTGAWETAQAQKIAFASMVISSLFVVFVSALLLAMALFPGTFK
jgi:hypothetical protein